MSMLRWSIRDSQNRTENQGNWSEFLENKDENVHRLALSAIRGELLEREGDSFGILYIGYLLSIVKIKREIERERERKKRGKRGR